MNRELAQVCWSLTAASDLEATEAFIARDSVAHALAFVDRLVDSAQRLALRPPRMESVRRLAVFDCIEAFYNGRRPLE